MDSNLYIVEEDRGTSPGLQYLPGGEISYQGKPMTSMNTALPYPYCTVRPDARQFLGYTPAIERTQQQRGVTDVKLFPNPKQRELIYKNNWDEAIDSISDDEDATYVPVVSKLSPSQRVANYLEDITTPELESIEAETKKLREDVQACLKRLQTEPKLPANKLYTTYDFSKVYREPKTLEPKSASDYYGFDDDEEHFNIRRRRTFNGGSGSGSSVRHSTIGLPGSVLGGLTTTLSDNPTPARRSYLYQPTSVAGGLGQQHFNPYEYLAENSKIDPVAKVAAELEPRHIYDDYDEDIKPPMKPKSVLDTLYSSVLDDDELFTSRLRAGAAAYRRGRSMTSTALAPRSYIDYEPEKNTGYNGKYANYATSTADSYYRPKYRFDSDASTELKNNIAIKAQYASNRAKANLSLQRDKSSEYLMS